MQLLKILLWAIVIYYIYKFVFNVVVPVSKAAKQMKQTVQKMQDAQQQQQNQQQQQTTHVHTTTKPSTNITVDADYIEFEEIKEPK
jgi:uncharacterized protein YybS (DUF2232 family)